MASIIMREMYIQKFDKMHKFISTFCPQTGVYVRTGVLEGDRDTGIDPFMAEYPELIDVGIMGNCIFGTKGLCLESGVECYQNGKNIVEPNMLLANFKKIAEESKGKVFQIALGGRGDPDQHEDFEEILQCCENNQIVPNFTSSGIGFTEDIVRLCKQYCGAVAISWYRNACTHRAIQMLLDAKVRTNIHFILSKTSIDEAIDRLQHDRFPAGINAVVFLLHKPVGLGSHEKVLTIDDERLQTFFQLAEEKHPFRVGFDSCSVPGLLNIAKRIRWESIDTCEAGRWSMYISSDMVAMPCSFDNDGKHWSYNINESSIASAWQSEVFNEFRNHFGRACPTCKKRELCLGGCPIVPEVVLCQDLCRI